MSSSDLLRQRVTLSPAMGVYLNLRGNEKEDVASGRVPDENCAGEVLQLSAIGLVELAEDGTPRAGVAIDTYGQNTISGLARVFTGWTSTASTAPKAALPSGPW